MTLYLNFVIKECSASLWNVLSNTNIKHLVTNKLYSVLRVTQTHFSFVIKKQITKSLIQL